MRQTPGPALPTPLGLSRNVVCRALESKASGSLLGNQLRHQLPEAADGAASAHARMDGVAPGAQPIVLQLQISGAVEVEAFAIFIELGADPGPVGQDEIDPLGANQECPANGGDRDAIGAGTRHPADSRGLLARYQRNAQDDFVLHDQASNRLLHGAGLHGGEAEQDWKQAEDRPREHLSKANHGNAGFAANR